MTKKKAKKSITGDHDVGYGRPPKSGQIRPGEVRNPWGKTGKPKLDEDSFLKVAAELISANVNGEVRLITWEEATHRTTFREAVNGKPTALKLASDNLNRRRPSLPPMPTPDELAKEAAELEEKKKLTENIVQMLQEAAAAKKRGTPRVRFSPDGKPIPERKANDDSPSPLDQPVKKPGG